MCLCYANPVPAGAMVQPTCNTQAETELKIELLSQSVLRVHDTFLRT
jgi:hypothetical protein